MSRPIPAQLLRGTEASPPAGVDLVAGHLRAVLDGVDLREIRIAGASVPAIDRIYVAVRDRDWDTIPGVVSDLVVEPGESSFRVTFVARHVAGDIDYAWQGLIEGDAEGEVRYTMRGQANAAFDYCRIGFCVLHPDVLAGSAFRARTPEGPVEGRLPRLVAPQLIVDGLEQPLIPPFHELVVDGPDGRIETTVRGDLFETEDQRNWTDASFKSYCTPLRLGYPHRAQPGQTFEQVVAVRIRPTAGDAPRAARDAGVASTEAVARLDIGNAGERPWPAVGLGLASDGPGLTAREEALLGVLGIDHLRVDVRPSRPGWGERIDEAVRQATQLGCGLEVALFVPAGWSDGRGGEEAAREVAARLGDARVARWLVFDEPSAANGTTPDGLVRRVRAGLGASGTGVPVAGGTDADFAELNRAYPRLDELDALVYAINPQVHASDDRSILENATAQGATVVAARSNAEGRAVCVSPVTLAPRFNPAAGDPDARDVAADAVAGALPRAVDARQMSLLGAAWTVASMAALTAAGADAVTWFETVGWRGLIERETGSPLPERFPSSPGMAFPMYHVFADVAEMRGGQLLDVRSSAPRALAGLAVRRGERVNGLLANLTPEALRFDAGPVGEQVLLRVMGPDTVEMATGDPDGFRRFGSSMGSEGGRLRLTLAPYAVVVFGTVV